MPRAVDMVWDLMILWLTIWITSTVAQKPATYTEDLTVNLTSKDFGISENLPDECRIDVCLEEITADKYKGNITWPRTLLGQRRYITCPYTDNIIITYASRDCAWTGYNATWLQEDDKGCPNPPLNRYLTNLNNGKQRMYKEYDMSLREINKMLQITKTDIIEEDWKMIHSFLKVLIEAHLNAEIRLNKELFSTFIQVADYIMGPLAEKLFLDIYFQIPESFTNLWIMLAAGSSYREMMGNPGIMTIDLPQVCVQQWTITAQKGQTLSKDFRCHFSNLTVTVTLPEQETDVTYQTNVFMVNPSSQMAEFILHGHFLHIKPPPEPSGVDRDDKPTRRDKDRGWAFHSNQLFTDNLLYVYIQKRQSGSDDITEATPGGVDVYTSYAMDYVSSEATCAATPGRPADKDLTYMIAEPKLAWLEAGCWLLNQHSDHDINYVHCFCNVTGFLGVFAGAIHSDSNADGIGERGPANKKLKVSGQTAGFSVFLRFPYVEELHIVGHVMRGMSLICLVLTISTYAFFKRARRGTPTWILLHLCASLIALLVVLYISEAVAGSWNACRVASAMRLYLILVSLMWNGVEAVNMYLMLVRVFNSDIPHFIIKAAALAWGIPALIVLLIPAINPKAFNGTYEDCKFRCELPVNTLHFAFMLPMCIIILHNIVIFCLVIKVLRHHATSFQDDRRQSRVVQLCGAVTMLVLLGVPWIFSAFGAIDSSDNQKLALLEGIFQVIFVVFVDLQGIFIFIFHCARIREVRVQWKAAVSSSSAVRPADRVSLSSNKTRSSTLSLKSQVKVSP